MSGTPITNHFDDRGFLAEIFNQSLNTNANLHTARTLYVRTKRGAIRGLHVSNSNLGPNKFISCVRGEIYEVYLDLRRNSDSFMTVDYRILSENNPELVYIPAGVAHGYQSTSDEADVIYQLDNAYQQGQEIALNPIESTLGISWPLQKYFLSNRDLSGISVRDYLNTQRL